LNISAKATFDDVHTALSKRLMASKAMDESFLQTITESAATLSAPLAQEKIETTITKDGKRKVEVMEIGKRVAMFKKLVEKEEANLKENWKRWDEVQNEYMELGIEVFGPEVFGEDTVGVKSRDRSFKGEVKLFNLEHNTGVGELDEEVEDNSAKILQTMKSSEKVRNLLLY
jgi:phosphopantothenoylcysteine decarboxylase